MHFSTLHYLQKLRLNLPNMLREGISEMPGFSQELTLINLNQKYMDIQIAI